MFFEVIRSRYYTAAFTLPRLKYLLSSYGADVERRICGPLRWLIPFFRILRRPSISNPSNLTPLLHINPRKELIFFPSFIFGAVRLSGYAPRVFYSLALPGRYSAGQWKNRAIIRVLFAIEPTSFVINCNYRREIETDVPPQGVCSFVYDEILTRPRN